MIKKILSCVSFYFQNNNSYIVIISLHNKKKLKLLRIYKYFDGYRVTSRKSRLI